MGKFRPMLRSPRSESMKVIVLLFGCEERLAKKLKRRWKAWLADIVVLGILRSVYWNVGWCSCKYRERATLFSGRWRWWLERCDRRH